MKFFFDSRFPLEFSITQSHRFLLKKKFFTDLIQLLESLYFFESYLGDSMGIILTIIIGFFVGLFARAITTGKNISGFIMTSQLGIAGTFFGKFLGESLGLYTERQP